MKDRTAALVPLQPQKTISEEHITCEVSQFQGSCYFLKPSLLDLNLNT